jgi:uncharacterized coiled-coil protein SlyX
MTRVDTGAVNDVVAEDLRNDAERDQSGRDVPVQPLRPGPPPSRLELLEEKVGEQERLIRWAAEVVARARQEIAGANRGKASERTKALLRARSDLPVLEEALRRGRLGPAKERAAKTGRLP